jgi:WS/DGAT/MGAT family acyltransferase
MMVPRTVAEADGGPNQGRDDVAQRLGANDAAFLYLEEPSAPQHAGTLAIFEAGRAAAGFDFDALLGLVRVRLPEARRYRQRVLAVPARLASPVWVDDANFDLGYHVRRSALPRPGTEPMLHELVARIMSRPLDRSRPLWELYFVEGLARDRFALLAKTHHAQVDGVETVDLLQLILQSTPNRHRGSEPAVDGWRPEPSPTRTELMSEAVAEAVRRPRVLAGAVRAGMADVRGTAGTVAGALGQLASATRTAIRPRPPSPLTATAGALRVYATVDTDLAHYKDIRAALGGSINDVVLATITGALRMWLQSRGEPVASRATVRATVPVSVHEPDDDMATPTGRNVSSYPVDLPVGEPSAVMRLHQIGYATQAHKDTGRAVGAEALVRLTGFSPPTLHALGARVASTLSRRGSNLVITNVPGPQSLLYAAAAPMVATYPIAALAKGQAVSIGVTSYHGGVYFGLNADRDCVGDVDVLADLIEQEVGQLVETAG